MISNTVFKSAESRDLIRSRYAQILSVFPFGQNYVETSFGRTFLLEAGAPENPPLILLHGSCSNSAFWFGEMAALSQMYHVFAVDIVGEAGNSDENRLDLHSAAYADWLNEVFDRLNIVNAVVAGNSLGAWMALKLSVTYPERVSELIVIAPSGLSNQNNEFLDKAKNASSNNEVLTLESSVTEGAALPKEVEEFINLILRGYNPITETLPVFTDEQLRRLTMPVLFIAGKHDVMVDAVGASQRLNELLAHAEVHVLENAGHMILNAIEYMIPFLQKERHNRR